MWFDQGELEPYEEGGDGDPSIVRARNKKDPVESLGDPFPGNAAPVSYTHLTLPTILLV